MASTYTYDIGNSIGKLRFLIQDHDVSLTDEELPIEKRSAAFSDEELAFILSEKPDLYYAAAMALRVWANNKQLIVIARRNSRATLDYGDIREDLLKAAKAYEEMALDAPADMTVDMNWGPFSEQRIIWNDMLRNGL